MPYTNYEYRVRADNGRGTALSVAVVYRTSPGTPSGNFTARVDNIGRTTVEMSWTQPSSPNGPIQRYVVTSTTQSSSTPTSVYEGLALRASISGLRPYTRYTFTVSSCTDGGCLRASGVAAVTLQAAPVNQLPPSVTPTGPYQLLISWAPPVTPNGNTFVWQEEDSEFCE